MNKRKILLGAFLAVSVVGAGVRFLAPFSWHYGSTKKQAVIDVSHLPAADETLAQLLSSKPN